MGKLDKKKIEQITNFIINNITLAEATTMVVEKARETAEFIVNNNLDPKNFDSPTSRQKLQKKIKIHKGQVVEEKKESWYNNIINKVGFGKKKKPQQEHKGFTTSKNTKVDE